ncbi:MAG: hypothetical protein AB2598_02050 [Candidatus Thiodiazotropha sp.]
MENLPSQVTTAAFGHQALELFEYDNFDLVLLENDCLTSVVMRSVTGFARPCGHGDDTSVWSVG